MSWYDDLVVLIWYMYWLIILITDIDECSDGSDDCDDKALCENTEGSHTCTCNQGYSGTGLICTGMYLTSHVCVTYD